MQKFADDERLEQMSMQRRKLKEAEHRREVEELWAERLEIYR
jgi:shikimate kinase